MAESRAIINVDINTSDAAAGLRQLQSQINAFNSTLTKSSAVQATAMRNAKDNLLELVNASRFFTAETVKMQTAAAGLDKTLSKGQVTLGQFFGAKFRKDGAAAAQILSLANARAAALQTQFVATGAAANGFREAIAIRPLQAFNDAAVVSAQKLAIQRAMLNQATTSMINFGKNTQWAGRQLMVGFTVPLSIFGAMAGKTFMDLEKEATNFKKVYGDAFTPPAEMEQNLAAVKELAKEFTKYGIAVKDTVGLAAQAAAAGAQNKDLIDATTQSTRLATLGQMDQNQALETTISLQNAFRLSGDELAKSINFLNMVENQTVVTLQDLTAAIPRVAPVIQGLGGSVEDLAAFLAAMEEGGVSAEQGANALKSGLASLINPTDRALEKLQALGISLDTIIEANRGDLMGTVQAFSRALQTVDEFSRQQALEQVFGKFQYARLGALFDNITKSGSQASRVIDLAGMSAVEMAASAEKELTAIEESAGTKLVAAMERLKLAIAPIGELFVKIATPVVNLLATIAEKFNALPDSSKKFIGIATVITGVVIPAGTMFLGLLMNLVGTLVKFGNIVGLAFKGFVSGGFKGAFDNVSQALRYMSLSEIDAENSARQLAGATENVNVALRNQVGASEGAQAAIYELSTAYEILTRQMQEAANASQVSFGVGAAAMGQASKRAKGRKAFNKGGSVVPGTGNRDTVPAILTPGEFVVNKKATKENFELLETINSGGAVKLEDGGQIDYVRRAYESGVGSRSLTNEIASRIKADSSPVRTQRTHFSKATNITSLKDLEKIPGYNPRSKNWAIASELIKRGLFAETLSDDWLRFPSSINQAARFNTSSPMTIEEAIKVLRDSPDKVASKVGKKESLFARVYPNLSGKDIAEGIIKQLQNRNPRELITDDILTDARNKAFPAMKTAIPKITGMRLPSTSSMANFLGINTDQSRIHDDLNKEFKSRGLPFKSIKVTPSSGSKPYFALSVIDKIGKVASFAGARGKSSFLQKWAASTNFNKGGKAKGAGAVPAMLTPGEYIVSKDAAQSNIALLQAINSGKIKGFASGGEVIGYDYVGREITDPDKAIKMVQRGEPIYNGKRAISRQVLDSRTLGQRISVGKAIQRQKQASRVSIGQKYSNVVRGGVGKMTGMSGMRGMGMGMGMSMAGGAMMMGASSVGAANPALGTAMQVGGSALSMASMLPMMAPMLSGIAGPLAAIAPVALPLVAALGAATAAIVIWRKSVDGAATAAAEMGANIGGTANSLNKMAEVLGMQTPAQARQQLQMGIAPEEAQEIANQFAGVFESGAGQKFIEDLQNSTSSERFKKLSDYLKSAVAAGMMDQDSATKFAKAVGMQLGDSVLANQAISAIGRQATGTAAMKEIADMRKAAVDADGALIELASSVGEASLSNEAAGRAIGAATQIIQDYGNVIAIAQKQYAEGAIGWDQYHSAITEARQAQEQYTDVIKKSVTNAAEQGAARQALNQQMVAAGLTEDQIDAITNATNIGISTLGGARVVEGQKIGTTTGGRGGARQAGIAETAYQEQFMLQQAEEQYGKSFAELSAAQQQFLSDQSKQAQDVARQVDLEGLNEAIKASVLAGEMSAEQAVVFGQSVMYNVDALNALANGASIATAQFIMFSKNIPGLTKQETERVRGLGVAFESIGGDIGQFENYLASIPENLRDQSVAGFAQAASRGIKGRGISAEESLRRQTDYMLGFQGLSQSIGAEQAVAVQRSKAGQAAVAQQGGMARLQKSFAAAKEVGVTENVIKYVIETEGAKDPQDMINTMDSLTKAQENIMSLPDDMVKGLEIDVTDPEDLRKFGNAAQTLKDQWKILENLNPNIDMVAAMKFLTLDENGDPLSADEVANRTIKINKAWKAFQSGKPEVRKQAMIDIATAYAGNQDVSGVAPSEIAAKAISELQETFKNFENLDPIVAEQMIQIQTTMELENLEDQAKLLDLKAKGDAAIASGDINAASGYYMQAAQIQKGIVARTEAAAAQIETLGAGAEKRSGSGSGGGGGNKEKTIMQELRDQAKLSGKFIEEINNLRVPGYKKFISGPFAPEFLEYLRGQGEKGLKLIKGGLDKVKQAYALFVQDKSSQLAAQAMSLPFVLANQLKTQKKDFAFRKDLVDQGFSLEETKNISDQTKEYRLQIQVNKDLIRQEMKKKKEQRDQGLIERLRKENALFGKGINSVVKYAKEFSKLSKEEKNFEALQSATENMNDEFDLLSRQSGLVAAGFNSELAAAMANAGLSASSSANQLSAFADQFERIQVMNATLDPIGFNLRGLQIQADILANNERIAELQKELAVQEQIEPLRKELELYERQNEQLSRKIELRERDLEPLDEAIEKLELERETIEKSYDARLEALDEILNLEESVLAVRERNIDVADALSRGDIAAASKAAIEVQKEIARQSATDQRTLLERQRQLEIEAIDERINVLKGQRKIIEDDIKNLQLQQRGIQDTIYTKQQFINSETERLNNLYGIGKSAVESLKNELEQARLKQVELNNAAAEYNKIKAQVAPAPAPAPAPAATGPSPMLLPGFGITAVPTGWTPAGGGQTLSPTAVANTNKPVTLPGFGITATPYTAAQIYAMTTGQRSTKRAFGGMISYKGSREPAPGMMYGGKMKGYAAGSYVAGNGMIDSVPALLTPGEFVVRKPVAQIYGPMLESLNGNVFPRANFNRAMPRGTAKDSGSMYNYNVNVTLNGTDMNPDDVANVVMQKIKMKDNMNVRNYNYRG